MKRVLTTSALMAFAVGVHAQSSVTIYGSVDATVGQSKTTTGTTTPGGSISVATPGSTQTRMDSSIGPGSRLGFRGTEDLGDGLKANFVLEMGMGLDNGNLQQGGLAFGRQSWVGLSSNDWSLTLGRQNTPIDIAFGISDAMGGVYWGNALANSGHSVDETLAAVPGGGAFQSTSRADNSIMGTWNAGPVTARLMVAAGNENSRGTGRLVNPGLFYKSGALQINASYARLRQNAEAIIPTADPEWLSEWLIGGSYDFGPVRVFTGYFTLNGPDNRTNLSAAANTSPFAYSWSKNQTVWLGAQVPVGLVGKFTGQLTHIKYEYASGPDGKGNVLGFVYEHYLSKRTVLYANYGQTNNNAYANGPLLAAVPALVANGYGSKLRAVALGIRHTF